MLLVVRGRCLDAWACGPAFARFGKQTMSMQLSGTPHEQRGQPGLIEFNSKPDAAFDVSHALQTFFEATGLPCFVLDRDFGRIVATSRPDLLPYIPPHLSMKLIDVSAVEVERLSDELSYFVLPMPFDERHVIAGYVLSTRGVQPAELQFASMEANLTQLQLTQLLEHVPVCDFRLLKHLLEGAQAQAKQLRRDEQVQAEMNTLSQQIDYALEEISLLHRLTQNLHVSKSPVDLANLCTCGVQTLIECSGVAICLEGADQAVHFLTQGRLPFDRVGLARLLARFDQHDWTRPLVKNKLLNTLLGQDFPGLKNLLVVPIGEPQYRRGWVVAVNLRGGRDFGSVEANLISSLAKILGTHVRNIELFDEHDDLLIGFVRSLVSTLDAKDPYTRGHSERVALLARQLGEKIGLETGDLDDIYLSGLLHDIGKIGVDDRILAKPGQLTEDEFKQIQRHPTIGYEILKKLRNLSRILPGVRSHHEAYNGKGYPDNLKADEIPLMARIIAVADSYDAMTSDRPYRKGMPLEKLDEIFRRGSGEQWDPRVVEAYFQSHAEFQKLCASHAQKGGNLLEDRAGSRSGILVGRVIAKL
jgi:HD-GYP domain-containing protein (c-di-GMP phosphodiesterase class II)